MVAFRIFVSWSCLSCLMVSVICFGQERNLNTSIDKVSSSGCINLLISQEVRKELRLDDVQVKELNSRIEAVHKAQEEMGKLLQSGVKDPRKFTEIATKARELQEETEDSLWEILDPVQADRFAQICIAKDGARSLAYLVVAQRLQLTLSQWQKVNRLKMKSASGVLMSGTGTGKEFIERMKTDRETQGEGYIGLLTAEQKNSFYSFRK